MECKRDVREAGLGLIDVSTFIANLSKSTANDAAQGANKPTQVLNSSKNGIENYTAGFILPSSSQFGAGANNCINISIELP